MADSIKNHLATQFNDWRQLMEHIKSITKKQIDLNLTKHKDLILYLQRSTEVKPDIDAFTLPYIYSNYIRRLQEKLLKIKDLCKKGNLEQALLMRKELAEFKQQLQELEERSTLTQMFHTYLKLPQEDEDLLIYKGVTCQKQFFLLRKQYDNRMKQLAKIGIS